MAKKKIVKTVRKAKAKTKPAPKAERKALRVVRGQRSPKTKAPEAVEDDAQPETSVDLGPIILPEPDDAVRVLKELAQLSDRMAKAHQVMVEQQVKAKTAKGKWESLAEEVQKLIRRATHASDLPLFDAVEREADQATMEAAAVTGTGF